MTPTAVLYDAAKKQWLNFQNPLEIITADQIEAVLPALRRIETAVNEQGFTAAGFLSYEAAPAFDPALPVKPAAGFPLLWFGLYDKVKELKRLPAGEPIGKPGIWKPNLSRGEYDRAFARIKEHLEFGNIYQVNYTFRLRSNLAADGWQLFRELAAAQPAEYAAWVDTGRFAVCSVSPELFFRLDGRKLLSKPMKGTTARGLTLADDRARAEWLRQSEKNRAENIMIVDMVRNDMGRVAQIGSVQVPHLYDIERYPTVWQMTSTVAAETDAAVTDIFQALFPCASITGAPKARSMKVIQELETAPRHIYTGSIGFLAPNRKAQFNVAIRTVLLDREQEAAEYGVGGGIVWDSTLGDEYEECLTKARVLTEPKESFELFETLLWTPAEGFFLLSHHLDRLRDSAHFFGFVFSETKARAWLESLVQEFPKAACRVKFKLSRNGMPSSEWRPLSLDRNQNPVRLGLAAQPVDLTNPFLYHKTTRREVYEKALADCPGCDEVVLWNERGEVTETTIANLVVRIGNDLVTPPVSCGLLGGTFRAWLLEQGLVREQVVSIEEFQHSAELFVVNSVRKWRKAVGSGK